MFLYGNIYFTVLFVDRSVLAYSFKVCEWWHNTPTQKKVKPHSVDSMTAQTQMDNTEAKKTTLARFELTLPKEQDF